MVPERSACYKQGMRARGSQTPPAANLSVVVSGRA